MSSGSSKSLKKDRLVVSFSLEPRSQWYDYPPIPESATTVPAPSPTQLSDLLARAASLYSSAVESYQSKHEKASSKDSSSLEAGFLSNIAQSGTLSDRLSALTLMVQSSPVHNAKALETLKGMVERGKGKGGREESLKALRCIVDWWVGGGAPGRKLRYFRDQPMLLHPKVTNEHLALWYFEDWLKKYFFSLLQVIETLSLDPLTYVRTQTLAFLFTLLRDKPEQEHNLLRLLVNKLGDIERSICSRSSFYILQLLQTHPSMKTVVVKEIAALVFRPTSTAAIQAPQSTKHIRFNNEGVASSSKAKTITSKKTTANEHASYYATISLNQIVLSQTSTDQQVARQLLDIYFDLFKTALQDYEDEDTRREEGLNSEQTLHPPPGAGGKTRRDKERRDSRVKEEGSTFVEIEDSNSRHISAILTGVNRALPYARLTAADVTFNKRVDTLFLITHKSTFNISLQALLLILQISTALSLSTTGGSASSTITDRYYRTLYASLHDSRLASSSKQAMYLNLLFKSLKADQNQERVAAFIRRFVQTLVSGGGGGTEFTAGGLYLLGELFSTLPDLRKSVLTAKPTLDEQKGEYDPKKRDPQFAHATASPMWELTPLLHHYHPTVALHSRQLLLSQPLTAVPDLSLNTLSHFLDRFVYKNPKKGKNQKGASAMQPAATAADGTGVKLHKGEVKDDIGLMNDPALLRRKPEDVPVDQLFFHKYFSRKHKQESLRARNNLANLEQNADSDNQENDVSDTSSATDEDEAEIWKAMKATMPRVEGDEDLLEDPLEGPEDSDGFDFSSEMSDPSEGDEDEEQGNTFEENAENLSDGGGSDHLSLVEASDAEDLINLNDEVDVGIINAHFSDSESEDGEEWGGVREPQAKSKRKRGAADNGHTDIKGKKRKLRSLPTFASYDDYAAMIDDGPEDDI